MKTQILTCGLSEQVRAALGPMLQGCDERAVREDELVALVDAPPEIPPAAVICGQELRDPGPIEAAQLLRSQFQDVAIYLVVDALPDKERRLFLKNGFSDVFSLRLDLPLLQRAMAESVGLANGVRAYRPARIIDLEPGETLGFDTALFLPGNNRYVRLSAAGDPLDEEMVLRLRQRGVRSLHVPLDQMRAYRDYTASRLKKLASAGAAPADSEKRVAAVRDLIAGLVYERETEDSIGSGRAVMGQATEIVADYIKGSPSGSIYDKILELSDEGNAGYSHSVNVSTVAALFALGTGLANPEHMALAGLLHDTGASAEDEQLEGLDESQLSAEQRAGLHFGPIRTLELIKKRKLILPTQVSQAIADHHERHDGRGYPEGKIGPRISTEAVLLALADDLDRVTQPVAGRPRKTVQDWVKLRRQAMSAGVGRCEFNPAIVAKVLELFP